MTCPVEMSSDGAVPDSSHQLLVDELFEARPAACTPGSELILCRQSS